MSETINNLGETGNFIHEAIKEDLGSHTENIITRFPPEPNGYLHIGHAKSVCLNFGLAQYYKGKCNLRFDDTNPAKEDVEYVNSIQEDIKWLGFDWEDRLFYASDYFERMYELAEGLIEDGYAFVCDMSAEEIKLSRGSLKEPGKESPYRNRSIEENLDLFRRMRKGEFADGEKTLRAKIDMSSPNINMRDPVIYRISHKSHHSTGDKWCIYPMYDYAHPVEDALEEITHSICTMEFEDHRPLYDWVVEHVRLKAKPRQIEFAKLNLTDTIMGKRYLRNLVENNLVDGWDDPRLCTISGIRRRGYTPESIRNFCAMVGVSKANSVVDIAQLEYCIREDLQPKVPVMHAVLEPIKLVITNYPENQSEELPIDNHPSGEMGERKVTFSRELYIEASDFMIEPPKKYFRLFVGNEVRLKGAYFVTCTGYDTDENGKVTTVYATYDPKTKNGLNFTERKVKGTIHWVDANTAKSVKVNLYENLVIPDENSETGYSLNPESLKTIEAFVEPKLIEAVAGDRFQFMRNGYFVADSKHSKEGAPVFNRIVSLKSSFKNNK
ncbi:MAG: glutamine--tRNA ligase/YqeY domain fusion protein [Firmicutes bacterium]|nr:glutamine--tRNA ligase/YqeY domain fusion protein [Bacillota bacterium]